jgi:hypothetical protein
MNFVSVLMQIQTTPRFSDVRELGYTKITCTKNKDTCILIINNCFLLHRVDVESLADVSEVRVSSIFRVDPKGGGSIFLRTAAPLPTFTRRGHQITELTSTLDHCKGLKSGHLCYLTSWSRIIFSSCVD